MQSAAADVQQMAISLRDRFETTFDINDLLIRCLGQIERRIGDAAAGFEKLADRWRTYHILQGRQLELDVYGKKVCGRSRRFLRMADFA